MPVVASAEQPLRVRRLTDVLEVVADHADQADTQRHGRVPGVVDDAVEVVRAEAPDHEDTGPAEA